MKDQARELYSPTTVINPEKVNEFIICIFNNIRFDVILLLKYLFE